MSLKFFKVKKSLHPPPTSKQPSFLAKPCQTPLKIKNKFSNYLAKQTAQNCNQNPCRSAHLPLHLRLTHRPTPLPPLRLLGLKELLDEAWVVHRPHLPKTALGFGGVGGESGLVSVVGEVVVTVRVFLDVFGGFLVVSVGDVVGFRGVFGGFLGEQRNVYWLLLVFDVF